MPVWLQWALIIAGVAASVFLTLFIRKQSGRIRRSKTAAQKTATFTEQRRASMIESVRIIAMAIEQDQVEYSEACIRIKGLLDHLEPSLMEREPYRVFLEVSDLLQHMPTHKARQQTNPRFVRKMDKERFEIEGRHADAIRRGATALRQHSF
ncbi:DUF2489 domain-containing protein [Marinobacter sp. X15-166B]|uniref:DUF2489 domain-containing protein n=1 Tax=Marinobacter sp. X15-166B TaxID=1897620 RepID=UPI00085C5C44|nr:DUF2489 domain-containing protein [Marinobacter sp. X15-166B]OEY66501.1 hypothetical protein BG841_08545 [Marinobacter sp. X15-166B]